MKRPAMSRYSAKQKKMRGIGGRSKRKFLQLYTNVKRSAAYHHLSSYARSLLFELIDRYNGCNNGMIGFGVREAVYELGCCKGTVSNAMRELDDAGLARPTKIGAWRGKRATEWRLMWLRCDKTGELPVSVWDQRKPFSEFTTQDSKVHEVGHRQPVSSPGRTHRRKNSTNDSDLSSPGRTHIDIYQGERELDGCTAAARDDHNEKPKKASSKNFGPSSKEDQKPDPRVVSLRNWGENATRKEEQLASTETPLQILADTKRERSRR
jgi:hypothetical protein